MANAKMHLGRRPPKGAPALRLARLLPPVVAHPDAVDYLSTLAKWDMLGNDVYGDCVAVTWANTRRLVTSHLSVESYPGLDAVLELYKTQNPGFPDQDDGMEIQTCLEYLVKTGGPDGAKAVAFAKVDHTNVDEMRAAIAIFGSVWMGITVRAANEAEFHKGQPWDYVPSSAVAGGHSVISGGYKAHTYAGDLDFITWAAETSFTDAFLAHEVEEAWVVIWPEHLGSAAFQAGVDLAALASDYTALTGRPFPVQDPPLGSDAAFAAVLRPWVSRWHVGANRALANAGKDWLKAKNL